MKNLLPAELKAELSTCRKLQLLDVRESWEFEVARIDAAMSKLSDEHRTVLVLCEFEEMEYKQIAKVMGCSIGTIMSRLFYARRRLAGLLADLKTKDAP